MTPEQERALFETYANTVEMMTVLVRVERRQDEHESDDKETHGALSSRIASLETTRTRATALYAMFALVPSALTFAYWIWGLLQGSAKAQ